MMVTVNQIAAETKDKAFGEGAGLIGAEVDAAAGLNGVDVGSDEGTLLRGTDVLIFKALQHSAWASTVASTHLSDESRNSLLTMFSPAHVKSDPKPSREIAVVSVSEI